MRKHRRRAADGVTQGAVGRPTYCTRPPTASWDEALSLGRAARIPQRPGDRPRADRHDRLHDGLRHHRRRAGHRARQIQAARRRRNDEARQRRRCPRHLRGLGYDEEAIERILAHIDQHETIEEARGPRKKRHLRRYSTAPSSRSREHGSSTTCGHLRMIGGSTQPFISGAISKTINVPEPKPRSKTSKTAYVEAWIATELKAVSIYRNGSKRTQPHQHGPDEPTPARSRARWPKSNRCAASCPTSDAPSPTSSTSGDPRGLHHRGNVRRRVAGRGVPRDGQGRARPSRASPTRSRRCDLVLDCSTVCRYRCLSTSSAMSTVRAVRD